MHEGKIPDYVIQRVMNKRGRLHVFESLDPKKTALAVIDMQVSFVAEGQPMETPMAREIVPGINRLAKALREMGGVVCWVQLRSGDPSGASLWPLYHKYFFTEAKAKAHRENLTPGHPGYEIYPELDTQPNDLYAYKTRFSAFVPDCGNTKELLDKEGIENILFAGTVTNFCCETSARDAMMLGYRVVMVPDGNAARHEDDHLAGLTTVIQSFGDVRPIDEVIQMLADYKE
jgi:ureidoacrylate peracid hydrolase